MGSVNLVALRKQIAAQATRSIESRANRVLENAFNKEKKIFLDEFDNDPVTQSLKSGPEADDGIVKTNNGGNLHSLIGFNVEDEPTSDLRAILFDNINLRDGLEIKERGNKILVQKKAELPSLSAIESEIPEEYGVSDWSSKSWIRLIEDGIPWFRSYLFGDKYEKWSRSSMAIEAKNRKTNQLRIVRNETFGPIPYLSKLLRNLRNRIEQYSK